MKDNEFDKFEIDDEESEDMQEQKKKLPRWAKVIISIIIILVGLFVAGLIYVNYLLGKIERVDTSEISYIEQSEEDFEDAGEGDSSDDTISEEELDGVFEDVDIDVMENENISNILLIGQDTRDGTRARSDAMIIMSINKETNEITLVSIMRDMYVPIPGYSDNRINAAYRFGGMTLLDQVIEESLGVTIDGNVEVDFEGFINAFSEIGDIDIELYQAEADYLNAQDSSWNLTAGVNSLTPEQVLAYSRIRYVGNSDWERTDRQRRVLIAAFEKISNSSLLDILDTANNIFPYLTTDMTNSEILGYVYTIISSGMSIGETYRIPADGTYTSETLRAGMEVLVPDLEANSKLLQEYLYGTSE